MKDFLTAPGFLSPYGTFGADLSSIFAWLFTLIFLYGGHLAKKGQGRKHHLVTLWGMVAMIAYFTAYYLARSLGALSLEGKEGFGGPGWLYDFIFSPILTIHITAVSLGLVLAVYMIILGFRASLVKEGEMVLIASPLSMEARWIRYTLYGSGLIFGLIALLRGGPIQRYMVYLAGFLLVAGVILFERGMERWIPDGGVRHRKIGMFTLCLYLIALFTSTITYVMLYYIYPVKPLS